MLARLAVLLTLLIAAGCATARPDAAPSPGGVARRGAFEAWSACNGTGAFFCAAGPGGGAGVRHAWPQ